MLDDRRQRHRERPRELADCKPVLRTEPREQRPSGRIGERGEGAVQGGGL